MRKFQADSSGLQGCRRWMLIHPLTKLHPPLAMSRRLWQSWGVERQQLASATWVRSCSKLGVKPWPVGCMLSWLLAVWHSGNTIPPDWKKGLVGPIWKGKGDRQDCSSYHSGITLLSVPGKVLLAHLLLMPIHSHLVKHQRPEQSGFVCSKSTTDWILALHVLVEHQCEFWQGMLAVYVDLKKAFDSVHWGTLKSSASVSYHFTIALLGFVVVLCQYSFSFIFVFSYYNVGKYNQFTLSGMSRPISPQPEHNHELHQYIDNVSWLILATCTCIKVGFA